MGGCFSRVGGQNIGRPNAAAAEPGAPAVVPQPNPPGGRRDAPGPLSPAARTSRGDHRPRAASPERPSTPPGGAGPSGLGHAIAFEGAQAAGAASARPGSPGAAAAKAAPGAAGSAPPAQGLATATRPAAFPAAARSLSARVPIVSEQAISNAITTMSRNFERAGAEQAVESEEMVSFMKATQAQLGEIAHKSGVSVEEAAKILSTRILKTAKEPILGELQAESVKSERLRLIGHQNFKLLTLHSISKAHHELTKLGNTMQQHPQFKNLNPSDAWRMLIDSGTTDKRRSEFSFENEPGYMAGMYRGFNHMLQADLSGRKMNADLLNDIHSEALHGVMAITTFSDMLAAKMDSGIASLMFDMAKSDRPAGYGFVREDPNEHYRDGRSSVFGLGGDAFGTITPEGFEEIIERSKDPASTFKIVPHKETKDEPKNHILVPGISDPSIYSSKAIYTIVQKFAGGVSHVDDVVHPPVAAVKARVDTIFTEHHARISAATSEDDKIKSIASCCAELERTHAFNDGNARTIGFLVVNKLLLEAGLPPAMMEDPNRFDGFSADQLAGEIKKGQAAFRQKLSDSA
jgi:hypothetical protein